MALSVFLLGMSKGGFPVGSVALPLLILVWPSPQEAARSAVSFMLPLLCAMDLVAVIFYRRQIVWERIRPLFPAMLLGIAAGSALFVAGESFMLAMSDKALKLAIGSVGLIFVIEYAVRSRRPRPSAAGPAAPGPVKTHACGFAAGLTSTVAHAAGPVVSMYLLPQNLPKLQYAGTTAAFFWVVNALKLVPFAAAGRIEAGNLRTASLLLPAIPAGVALGYVLVRRLQQSHYVRFIYAMLLATSLALIAKALGWAGA